MGSFGIHVVNPQLSPTFWLGYLLNIRNRNAVEAAFQCVFMLRAYEGVSDARTDIAQHINLYNSERGRLILGDKPSKQFWLSTLQPLREAA